jgi:FkbM family methyltransferase
VLRTTKRPLAFVLTAANHGSMLVNRNDSYTNAVETIGVGYNIFLNSSCGQEEIDAALQLLDSRRKHYGDGVFALDCGANIGVHIVEWARHMHGWGEALAFEAQERIFYALAGNLTLNNCFNARALWAAVGAHAGEIRVPEPDYLAAGSFGSLEIRKTEKTEFIGQAIDYSDAHTRPVRMLAIDDLDLPRLDLIKIDIEGMELEALAGARKTIARHKPQMLIERIKTDQLALNAVLLEHGYKLFAFGVNLLAIHESDPFATQVVINR